jgi:hypothetical protein
VVTAMATVTGTAAIAERRLRKALGASSAWQVRRARSWESRASEPPAPRGIDGLTPGDNRAQGRWWTQLIFPVSGCGIHE